MVKINMQFFGGNGASSGKSGGGKAGGGAAKGEAEEKQSSMRTFDDASTDEKLKC